MQKVKIINSNGESIEFGMHSPFLLSHIEGLGIPTSDVYSTQSPNQDGSTAHQILLNDRILQMKVTVVCKGRAELYEQRRKIFNILNPKKAEVTILYTNDFKTYRTYGAVDTEMDFKERINDIGIADVTITCFDPYWLDENDTIRKIKFFEGGLAFPITFSTKFAEAGYSKIIQNEGDVEVPCVIEYIGTAKNPIIVNETTGEYVKINRTLTEGQKLVIDTAEGKETVDIVSASGTKTNVFNWLDINSTFFKLQVGENKISYSSDNEGKENVRVNIVYSNKYVGV